MTNGFKILAESVNTVFFFYILAQRKQTTQHALFIGKLEKEIGILSKDIKSFRIELTELRKQHQEDINRLETHVTENSKDIVGMFLFNLPGQVKPKTIKLVFVASPLSMQH